MGSEMCIRDSADTTLAEAGVGLNLKRIDQSIKNAEKLALSNAKVMKANMASQIRTSKQNIRQIGLEAQVQASNILASQMIFPPRVPYAPMPEMPPERMFVDRMEAIPGYTPPPVAQSTWAPILQGVSGAASAMTGAIDPQTGQFYS